MKSVIVDLDGTLADMKHRLHFIKDKPKNWKAFETGISQDTVIESMRTLIQTLKQSHEILIVTGRSHRSFDATLQWLEDNDIPFSRIFMRDDNDYRADFLVKKDLLDKIREDGYDVLLAIDDRDRCVAMYRENGLVCLQCANGDY